jgi:hypothetical protein
MTYSAIRVPAVALGAACLVWLSPLAPAHANMAATSGATSAPAQGASAPSGAVAATPGATSSPSGPAVVRRRAVGHHHYVHHNARYARYYRYHPIAAGAATVADGIADLGSIAAYPIYCFPNYGTCPVYLPY